MAYCTYDVSNPAFGKKIRKFTTRKEAHDFLDQKLIKIAKNRITYSSQNEKVKSKKEMDILEKELNQEYRKLKKQSIIKKVKNMNISSNANYPGNALSNFAPHPFVIDNIKCNSMEGFLQALKTKSPERQIHICTLVGRAAKDAGKNKNGWKKDQTLYWQGTAIKRESDEYQNLITQAYNQLSKNNGFQRALLATGNATLEHSIGRRKKKETVLTRKEFINQLTRLRSELNK